MNFKKNALKTAIAAAGIAGSSMSMAGTWAPAAAPLFATENFGANNTGALVVGNAVYTLGTSVANGSQNIIYTLTGGTWGGNGLTSASVVFTNTCTAAQGGKTDAMTFALVDGGANTDNTAQFRVTTAGAGATGGTRVNDTITLVYNVQGVTSLGAATTTGGPTLAFSIGDTVGNVDTSGAATVIASSIVGTTIAGVATAAGDSKIDVSAGTTQFTAPTAGGGGTLSFDAGSFTITDNGGAANGVEDDGATIWQAGTTDSAVTATTVTLTGDFSASVGVDTDLDGNTAEGEGVTISGCLNANATTLTATTATFSLTNANTLAALNTACDININVDGATVIPEFTPALTVAVDYTGATLTDEALALNLAAVAKDGSTAAANLLLNPTGTYDNFIRVSNASAVAGSVFATVYNDSGESVTFTLITSLGAQSSSDLISVEDLYASAQAADATFDVGTGKLRGSFTGEFANINVQNISTSTDGTTFFTF
ncbi:MAG: hypothetical protein ACJ0Q2_04100 [Candidatus Azotimanducaceae bacterium]